MGLGVQYAFIADSIRQGTLNMPFIDRANEILQQLPDGDLTKETVRYLLDHGHTTRHNPVPINVVVEHLTGLGLLVDAEVGHEREYFQHNVLVPSREQPETLFIGTFGAYGRGGIYLISDREDAAKTQQFYVQRIGRERDHLARLEELMDQEWPRS